MEWILPLWILSLMIIVLGGIWLQQVITGWILSFIMMILFGMWLQNIITGAVKEALIEVRAYDNGRIA
jgi:hypothetical protein